MANELGENQNNFIILLLYIYYLNEYDIIKKGVKIDATLINIEIVD